MTIVLPAASARMNACKYFRRALRRNRVLIKIWAELVLPARCRASWETRGSGRYTGKAKCFLLLHHVRLRCGCEFCGAGLTFFVIVDAGQVLPGWGYRPTSRFSTRHVMAKPLVASGE